MWGLNLNRKQRLTLGIGVLILVDIIWVASSELSRYIFARIHYDKPFFATYLKTAMFSIYLFGFVFMPTWHRLMCNKNRVGPNPPSRSHSSESIKIDPAELLSEPMFVPTAPGDEFDLDGEVDHFEAPPELEKSAEDAVPDEEVPPEEADEALGPLVACPQGRPRRSSDFLGSSGLQRSVRFSELSEVRQMATSHAEDANRARLSYAIAEEMREAEERLIEGQLPIPAVAKLALFFCILWFLGNYSYSMALNKTVPGIVNVLSSTSSLFTLILAAVLPSSNAAADRFSLSKCACVIFSIGGVTMISFEDTSLEHSSVPAGVIWSLCGALCYALYLVLLRWSVESEAQMSLPMFFGFVGIFNAALLWPGLFVLNAIDVEPFVVPNATEWTMLAANGLIGTVASELLWLWGCFLTSSLLATLSLSMTTPMTMVADFLVFGNTYSWRLYVGSIPVFFAFLATAYLSHRDNADPLAYFLGRLRRLVLPHWQATASSPYIPRRNTGSDANVNTEQEERLLDEEDTNDEDEDSS